MKRLLCIAVTVALLIGSNSIAGGDKAPAGKKFQINLSVFEGDPLGSREAGTLKLLNSPRIALIENEPGCFISGGEVEVPVGPNEVEFRPVGRLMEATVGSNKDGNLTLNVLLQFTNIEQGGGKTVIDSTRTITSVAPGETITLRWPNSSANKQAWVELSIEEIK